MLPENCTFAWLHTVVQFAFIMNIFSVFSRTAAILSSSLLIFTLCSCIDDEPLSMEADIEQVTVGGVAANRLFAQTSEAERKVLSQDSVIVFHLADGVEDATLDSIQLDFRLSQGATLTLVSDSAKFSQQRVVRYKVTSQDHRFQRYYAVQFVPAPDLGPDFNFDHPQLDANSQKFYVWPLEGTQDSKTGLGAFWGNGNVGFMLSNYTAAANEYPTTPTDDARSGMAVKLTTSSTGALGAMFGKPIAAGNFFVGTFNMEKALADALAATQFGRPVRRQPKVFKGYYKWQPGEQYRNLAQEAVQGPAADGRDLPQIYAVLYRNTDAQGTPVVLDGSNVLTHENVVATAVVENYTVTGATKTSQWASFEVPFTYHKALSNEVLVKRGYSLALVFSSSKNGAKFEGAIGSTLIIDDCSITY